MKKDFMKYLACPRCRGSLLLKTGLIHNDEIKEGDLVCKKCSISFPIRNYVPRFVAKDKFVESFSFEWKIHARTQFDSHDEKPSEKTFFEKTGFDRKEMKNRLFLDVGCGSGRFSDVVLRQGGRVIAVDLSYSVDVAQKNLGRDPNITIIQADVFNLPLKDEVFDYIFSIGVLQHTGNAKRAFSMLPRLLKNRGKIGIWVYSSQNPVFVAATRFWRMFTTRLPKKLLYLISFLIATPLYWIKKIPVIRYPFLLLVYSSMEKNPKCRVLDTFDYYSPYYMSYHSYQEVYNWFRANGLSITHVGEPTAMSGEKR